MKLQGIAELPLHEGHVPRFIFEKMYSLGSLIARYIVERFGSQELIYRLADPIWFQAFNNVIGMDWNSSGSTTVLLYILKKTFPPENVTNEEITVFGGKGRDALNTPREIYLLKKHIDRDSILRASRLSAKIDSTALQDDYQLYIHTLLLANNGKILVIQQGMNIENKLARRYHLLIEDPKSFSTDVDPHSAVSSMMIAPCLNLIDNDSKEIRRTILDVISTTSSESIYRDLNMINKTLKGIGDLSRFIKGFRESISLSIDKSVCPRYYRPITDVEKIHKAVTTLKNEAIRNFDDLLLSRGVGPETLRALTLVAHLIYGYNPSFKDPTTHPLDPFVYAFAHGGKDGVPYKIKLKRIQETVTFFQDILNEIKAGNKEREILAKNLAKMVDRLVIKGVLPKMQR